MCLGWHKIQHKIPNICWRSNPKDHKKVICCHIIPVAMLVWPNTNYRVCAVRDFRRVVGRFQIVQELPE
jgi:hypothetical protein